MTEPQRVDVHVYVHDGRISVQKVASNTRRGDPNRLYGNKIG